MVRNIQKNDGAVAKAAGMRQPSESIDARIQPDVPLMDEQTKGWQPGRISDRKLIELANRLEAIRTLGGAFAHVALSDEAQQRLVQIEENTFREGRTP